LLLPPLSLLLLLPPSELWALPSTAEAPAVLPLRVPEKPPELLSVPWEVPRLVSVLLSLPES